jgi:hypothetical protein
MLLPVAAPVRRSSATGRQLFEPHGASEKNELVAARAADLVVGDERLLGERMMGLEPTTFCMASRRSSQLSYIRAGRSIAPG